jgi:hypothetical protein
MNPIGHSSHERKIFSSQIWIFHRLGHQNRLRADYRFYLARRIREKKQIDQEIIDLIDYFKEK